MHIGDDSWWWFSFFDMKRQHGEQLLGVAVIQARDSGIAATALARFGYDPGGETWCAQIPVELGVPPELYRERLLDQDEARTLADLLEARRPVRRVRVLDY